MQHIVTWVWKTSRWVPEGSSIDVTFTAYVTEELPSLARSMSKVRMDPSGTPWLKEAASTARVTNLHDGNSSIAAIYEYSSTHSSIYPPKRHWLWLRCSGRTSVLNCMMYLLIMRKSG